MMLSYETICNSTYKELIKIDLPEHWGRCPFYIDDKLVCTIGFFEIYTDCYKQVLILRHKVTAESWEIELDVFDLDYKNELKKLKTVLNNYTNFGVQLSLL